ncbi:cyclic nucleotide-gated cation channel beta-1-like [Perca fluviatilis]|uniref:cyclic nucleotide-gated cation channel beta-1-like n=1 Tax=Perca fluviatilis TaxID=8168 RepID=UPI0019649635|nr:cyclic nucleotide-gated cation channel beta-1-like [Perca fluviatilis]
MGKCQYSITTIPGTGANGPPLTLELESEVLVSCWNILILPCLKFTLFCLQDLTKGFAQTWSKGEEKEEGEEEDEGEGEEEEDNVDEEEDNDTSAETEGRSSSLDDWTEKQTEETLTAKPEELKEESVPDGEQKAAAISEQADTTGGEKTDDGTKPANGTADSNSKSQSGSNKKLSLFRRLSFSRSKQTSDRDQTPAQGAISGDAAVRGGPLSSSAAAAAGSSEPETNRGGAPSGARGPRSGACTML